MPPHRARVLGPYRNGRCWRLVVFAGQARKAMLTDTQEEAEKLKASLLRMFEDRLGITLGMALDEYLSEKRKAGLKESSVLDIDGKLRSFLPLHTTLGEITSQHAAQMYQAETERVGRFGPVRAATHHRVLRLCKAFFGWAVEREYLRENPFAKLKAIGKARVGKVQLRQDEARKLNDLALKRAADGDEGALAVLVQLVMGLRSGEVLGLKVRDLDAQGTVLVIEGTKSKNARRTLEIESEPLRKLLALHCKKLRPEQLMFGAQRSAPLHTDRLFKALRKLCREAKLPCVCPHSLRGLHASLAVARGASSRFVAEALGHGNDTITKRHYIAPDAIQKASGKRVAAALDQAAADSAELDRLTARLRKLPPAQLAALLSSLGARR